MICILLVAGHGTLLETQIKVNTPLIGDTLLYFAYIFKLMNLESHKLI